MPAVILRGQLLVKRAAARSTASQSATTSVAVAAVNGMDYLLAWNLRHLANAALRGKIEGVCRDAGTVPSVICTPEELMEPKA